MRKSLSDVTHSSIQKSIFHASLIRCRRCCRRHRLLHRQSQSSFHRRRHWHPMCWVWNGEIAAECANTCESRYIYKIYSGREKWMDGWMEGTRKTIQSSINKGRLSGKLFSASSPSLSRPAISLSFIEVNTCRRTSTSTHVNLVKNGKREE